MGAPSIGSIPIRSAPQRCEKTTVDQLFQVVNNNCNSPVRCALLTWVQRFSPTLTQEFCWPSRRSHPKICGQPELLLDQRLTKTLDHDHMCV
jgi:hypothetical protein